MKNNTRNIVDLKQGNIREIIRILKTSPNSTKTGIADKMSMTIASAHNFISELLKNGICVSSGIASSVTNGRRAVKYRLNKDYGYIIGVTLARTSIHFAAYDLGNDLLAEKTCVCDIHDKESTTNMLLSGVEELTTEKTFNNKKCLCMGITIPGRADKDGRIVLLPDADIWRGFPLKQIFEQRFNIPAYVDNDNNAYILAAKWLGLVNGEINTVFFSMTEGVGMSVMNSQELFRGAQNSGSEIGHTIADINGRQCSCGNKGCFEAYISEQAVHDSMASLLELKYKAFLERFPANPSVAKIAAYAKKNKCYDLYVAFSRVSEYIIIALQNIIRIFDPATIIINCEWLKFLPEIFDDVKLRVYSYCNIKDNNSIEFIFDIDEKIIKTAPAMMAFDNYLSNFEMNNTNKERNKTYANNIESTGTDGVNTTNL